MQELFEQLTLHDFHDDAYRNIKTIRDTQDLYDDLSEDPKDWQTAIAAEMATKPPYSIPTIIERPFEEVIYYNAIEFPFTKWMESRYSDGRFGVWYGALTFDTTVYETVHHWRRMLDDTEGFAQHEISIVGERRVFLVRADAALLDFRARVEDFPSLIAPDDYHFTQEVGRRVHHEGHPGILTKSAHCDGEVFAIFRKEVLSNPRNFCDLTYRLDTASGRVEVERQLGTTMMMIN
ncbi:MAG: RES family NAD+ phosphorylase [Gammaproteobacteria bacterium]|nr:RES family NAD+ phosphorylase [Gammaproteobacteria bacterium]